MTTAAYTATGRPFTLAQPNGVGVTYGYDSLDRVMSMAWKKGTSPAFASCGYRYSPRGQRTSSTEVTGREAAYGYDDASRLTSETITGDPSGSQRQRRADVRHRRRLVTAHRVHRRWRPWRAQSFAYDANDQLTNDGYDLNGNTTSSGGHTYGYDFENRLVSKDSGAVTVVYDGDGNRIAKTAGGVTTKYLVDDLNPTRYLQVLDEVSGGAVQVRYTFGNMLVSQTRTPSAAPSTSFYGYDAHRNIAFLTDVTGTVTDTYAYDAWGNAVAATVSTPNTRLYEGQELDPDLGLINLRARQYNPSTGRFLTIDPLMGRLLKPTSLNRYVSSDADPENLWDPNGMQVALEEVGVLTAGSRLNNIASAGLLKGAAYATHLAAYQASDANEKEGLNIVSETAAFYGTAAGIAAGTQIAAPIYNPIGIIGVGNTLVCSLVVNTVLLFGEDPSPLERIPTAYPCVPFNYLGF